MKKIIYSILFTALTTGIAVAQDEEAATTGDSGEKKACCAAGGMLPVEGDIGIAIEASPFLSWIGNAFNNTSNQGAPNFRAVMLKYFIADDVALRGRFALRQQNTTEDYHVWTENPNDAFDRVTDTRADNTSTLDIAVGMEKRRGNNRLQGFYGGQLRFVRNGGTRSFYSYGNEMNAANMDPVSTGFGGGVWTGTTTDPNNQSWNRYSTRRVANYGPSTVNVNLEVVIGAEYFLKRKLSIGGEFEWGYGFTRRGGNGEEQVQYTDDFGNVVEETRKYTSGVDRTYGFNGSAGGNLFMHLYF